MLHYKRLALWELVLVWCLCLLVVNWRGVYSASVDRCQRALWGTASLGCVTSFSVLDLLETCGPESFSTLLFSLRVEEVQHFPNISLSIIPLFIPMSRFWSHTLDLGTKCVWFWKFSFDIDWMNSACVFKAPDFPFFKSLCYMTRNLAEHFKLLMDGLMVEGDGLQKTVSYWNRPLVYSRPLDMFDIIWNQRL